MLEINKARAYQLSGTVTLKNILNEAYFILDSATGKQYDLTEMEYDIVSLIDWRWYLQKSSLRLPQNTPHLWSRLPPIWRSILLLC